MDQIKSVIKDVVAQLSSGKKTPQAQILKAWPGCAGSKAFKHTKIIKFDKGVLLVNVDSSAWLFQMNLKRKALLEKLNSATKELKEIRFRTGSVK